jgi:hypothetical protein
MIRKSGDRFSEKIMLKQIRGISRFGKSRACGVTVQFNRVILKAKQSRGQKASLGCFVASAFACRFGGQPLFAMTKKGSLG